MQILFQAVGLAVVGGGLLAIAGLGRAFVGITLYRWFALPLGLPNISMGQLFGLMYLIGVVWQVSSPAKKKDDSETSAAESFFLMLVSLGSEIGAPLLFGWIIKLIIS